MLIVAWVSRASRKCENEQSRAHCSRAAEVMNGNGWLARAWTEGAGDKSTLRAPVGDPVLCVVVRVCAPQKISCSFHVLLLSFSEVGWIYIRLFYIKSSSVHVCFSILHSADGYLSKACNFGDEKQHAAVWNSFKIRVIPKIIGKHFTRGLYGMANMN